MEEDIKILEDVLKDKDTKLWIGEQGIQAIENLIARYKELEECLKAEESYSKSLNDDIKSLLHIEPNDNFIPKSKVKEILNKLSNHNYKCNLDDADFLQNIIIEIHQLLED